MKEIISKLEQKTEQNGFNKEEQKTWPLPLTMCIHFVSKVGFF
jgi:hypothetical protein